MIALKCIGVVALSILVCGLLGFIVPFVLSMFDGNPAWSFVPMLTIPLGVLVGLVIGIVLVFRIIRAADV